MYAIIRASGRQLRVEPGDTVYVDRMETPAGQRVEIKDVLLVGGDGEPRVGTPTVPGTLVVATVLEQGRDRKVRVFKFKRRKHYRRTRGHRQAYTALRVEAIQG